MTPGHTEISDLSLAQLKELTASFQLAEAKRELERLKKEIKNHPKQTTKEYKDLQAKIDTLKLYISSERLIIRTGTCGELQCIYDDVSDYKKCEKLKEKTKNNIGENEYNFFCLYFKIDPNAYQKVIAKIKELQSEPKDGIIGPNTLELIYTQYYFGDNPENPEFRRLKERIGRTQFNSFKGYSKIASELMTELYTGKDIGKTIVKLRYLTYRERGETCDNKKVENTSKDIFGPEYTPRYSDIDRNVNGTIVDARIKGKIPSTLDEFLSLHERQGLRKTQDGVYVLKDKNKKFICLYYENRKLKFACLISPGRRRKGDWPGQNSPRNFKITEFRDISHTFIDKGTKEEGSMPSSRGTTAKHIYFHEGYVSGAYESHGCFHLDGFFANLFLRTVKSGTKGYFRPNLVLNQEKS